MDVAITAIANEANATAPALMFHLTDSHDERKSALVEPSYVGKQQRDAEEIAN
jgi:hypothetical protein